MIVGCLGDLIFQVSSDTVMTVSNFVESASTRYAIHQRHNNSACLEYTGMDPDQITFDIELSAYLGIKPQSAINVLWSYVRSGLPVSMVLGQTVYGKWRWVVKSFSIKMKHTDKSVGRQLNKKSATQPLRQGCRFFIQIFTERSDRP